MSSTSGHAARRFFSPHTRRTNLCTVLRASGGIGSGPSSIMTNRLPAGTDRRLLARRSHVSDPLRGRGSVKPHVAPRKFLLPLYVKAGNQEQSYNNEVQQPCRTASTVSDPGRPLNCINDLDEPLCRSFTPRRSPVRRMQAGSLKVAGVESRHACVCHRRNRHHQPRAL